MSGLFSLGVALAIVAGASTAAGAVTIIPISASASSAQVGHAAGFAIDQGPGSDLTDWAAQGQAAGAGLFLNLDLGAAYTLANAFVTDRVSSGGANGVFTGNIGNFTTQFSLTAYSDATFTTAISGPLVFSKSAPIGPTGAADFLYTANLGGLQARFVRYSVLATGNSARNPGLSDIRFATDASPAPEPETWALLGLGMGLIGLTARRRKHSVTA